MGKNFRFILLVLLPAIQNCSKFQKVCYDGVCTASPDGKAFSSLETPSVRRLTNNEIQNSISLILGDPETNAKLYLPREGRLVFDNDVSLQIASSALIEGLEVYSEAVTNALLDVGADARKIARRDSVLKCQPVSSSDAACMDIIVKTLARLFFRGEVDAALTDRLRTFALSESTLDGNFYTGVKSLLRYFIQSPQFLFRVEQGSPNGSVFELSSLELASKLAFTLTGANPDDTLLKKAESGQLSTPTELSVEVDRLLQSNLGKNQAARFFALWFKFDEPYETSEYWLSAQRQALAMIERSYTSSSSWNEIFSSPTTMVDSAELAATYGINQLNQWVSFGGDRKGIFSTAAFLANGSKNGVTSPTQRGKFFRQTVLCETVPPPPPNVTVDAGAAQATKCKIEFYQSHTKPGTSCFNCHQQFDPIGFGLEKYDFMGRFSNYELSPKTGSSDMNCPVTVTGKLDNLGTFDTPAGLADLSIQSGKLRSCMLQRFNEYTSGATNSGIRNSEVYNSIYQNTTNQMSLVQLIKTFVMNPSFKTRSVGALQ